MLMLVVVGLLLLFDDRWGDLPAGDGDGRRLLRLFFLSLLLFGGLRLLDLLLDYDRRFAFRRGIFIARGDGTFGQLLLLLGDYFGGGAGPVHLLGGSTG